MTGQRQGSYRPGRRSSEQGPRPLSWNKVRVEKLATGTTNRTINHATTTSHALTAPISSIPTKRNQVQAQTTTTTTANKYVPNISKLTKHGFHYRYLKCSNIMSNCTLKKRFLTEILEFFTSPANYFRFCGTKIVQ